MKEDRDKRSPVIGVTGGVGSGKTSFVRELVRLGAVMLDADRIARRLVNDDPVIREGLRTAFGDDVFDASGILKRKELAARVFADPAQLKVLNGIVWPALVSEIGRAILEHRESGCSAPMVVDMAVLYEAGCEHLFDAVVAVVAPLEKRFEWLSGSRGWDESEIRRRMASQIDAGEKSRRAFRTVRNEGNLRDLHLEARDVFRDIQARFGGNGRGGRRVS
jgi:dephospho-CoA kinase